MVFFFVRAWVWLRRNPILFIALLITLAGLIIGGMFFYRLTKSYTVWGSGEVEVTKTGAVGDFIAGVVGTLFSLAGFVMVLLTYREQKIATEKDKKEARIFTLIQIHVDNSNHISYNNPYRNG
ncbi:hypothetical protein [Mucilaginibacter defluvii]|uniref:MotA/TolQ/ExbB proton channel family protein n=1 Tax=Mucilaginibacter defluvii TaxID=1196019 RepID=A0ABP9G0D4_9SPHI